MLSIAYGLFLLNFLFGLSVRGGVIDSSRFRFVHHALYFLVMASLLAAIIVMIVHEDIRGIAPLAAMALLLFGMTRFRGRGRGHAVYATICLTAYTVIFILT